jgi:hypothetical protein
MCTGKHRLGNNTSVTREIVYLFNPLRADFFWTKPSFDSSVSIYRENNKKALGVLPKGILTPSFKKIILN